jgi:hypothetical protein
MAPAAGMNADLTGIFDFNLGAGVGTPNLIQSSAFDFITKDCMLKLKCVLDAASAGATVSLTVTDENVPRQPYPPASIPVAAQGAGTITEYDPWLATVRVRKGSRVVIAIANPAAAVGRAWIGLE